MSEVAGAIKAQLDYSKENQMSLRQVLTVFNTERQLNDDETALLNALRSWTDAEREMFINALSDKPQKKAGKKAAGGGGKSKHASSLGQQIQKRPRAATADESDDDNRFDGAAARAAREDFIGGDTRCQLTRADGNPCKLLPDHNIHHMMTANEYHEFVAPPTTGKSDAQSAAGGSGD